MLPTILAAVVLVGLLIVMDRRDKRATSERGSHWAEVACLQAELKKLHAEHLQTVLSLHKEHRVEVQTLLQRIQAPEVAVIEHQQKTAGPDESYPLNDEESAEAQEERRLAIERLEALENELAL